MRATQRWLLSIGVMLAFFAGLCAGAAVYAVNALQPVEKSGREVRVVISPGMTSSQIADKLEKAGLIRDAFVFTLYLRYKGEGHRFQAGEYAFYPGMDLDTIVDRLNRGDTVAADVIEMTVPEGYTVEQIADILLKHGKGSREELLDMLSRPAMFSEELEESIPDDASIKYRLEGYLFPETYAFPPEADAETMIRRMVAELERKLNQLPDGWRSRMEELGLTLHELLTIASLIEREVVVDGERPLVASVIYNRLKQGQKLQIDATVQYALGKRKEKLLYEDLEVDSPYNTYKYSGLPPGPIASPGLASIEAALYPAETTYLFYVTKKDGSGEHYFSSTYEEHLKYKNLSEQNESR